VAAAGQPLLQRLQPVLPAAHPLVLSQPVLDEVRRPARLQDLVRLGQCRRRVRDGAQAPAGRLRPGRPPARALLLPADPAIGLTRELVDLALAWAGDPGR